MDLLNKHKERDFLLPRLRNVLLTKIQDDLLNDDNVLAFFYGGSVGNEMTDYFSDIDLRIVVDAARFQDFIQDKNNRSRRWGKVLYFENFNPTSSYTIAHYDCFIKVDVFYYILEDIKPSIWLNDIKIIKDSNQNMNTILQQSLTLTYKPTYDEFEAWRTKFFAYLHETYRRIMRQEYYYALNCVDKLRFLVVSGWYMDFGITPNSLGDWARYEGIRSELEAWQKALLEQWECERNTNDMMQVMTSTVYEFKKIHQSLTTKLGIEVNLEWMDKIFSMVL